jgi:parallel beta-helix repeat protein
VSGVRIRNSQRPSGVQCRIAICAVSAGLVPAVALGTLAPAAASVEGRAGSVVVRQSAARAVCARFVATSGSDRAQGTAQRPFRTVRRLVAALRPGETGCLAPGRFTEDVTIRRGGLPGKPITLRSGPGGRATIAGIVYVADSANDVVLSNLKLDGRNTSWRASPKINGDRVVLRGNEITNANTAICVILGPSFEQYGRARGTVVERNRIYHCGRLPETGHDHGIYVEGSDDARIVGNIIHDNADYGIHLYPDAQRTSIVRNVIDHNGGGIIFAGEDGDGEYRQDYASSNNVARNNVISNSRKSYLIEAHWGGPVGRGNVATRNCLWGGARGTISNQLGFVARDNVVARPQFVNRAHGNFRLRRGTACARILG